MATETISPRPAAAVLATARTLQQAAQSGQTPLLLKGKKLALLCMSDCVAPENALFLHAASELGAHVAQIHPRLTDLSTPADLRLTAQLLGRLYDAVQCDGVPPRLVRRIADEAGVPVYDSIASPHHPCAELAERLDGDGSPAEKRRFVLQAMLVDSIA